MCGIFCSLSRTHHILPGQNIADRLEARGPDSVGKVSIVHQPDSIPGQTRQHDDVYLTFYSTVLSLRGLQTVAQPYQCKNNKFTLCWNGEAWGVDDERPFGNDTEAVYRLLSEALESSSDCATPESTAETGYRIANALSRVAGPYAFVLFDGSSGKMFLGRDFLGRRSLLKRTTENGDLIIGSVSDGNAADGWTEIEANGIYCVDIHPERMPIVPRGSQPQGWGNFVAQIVPYNFVYHSENETGLIRSVIPHLSLSKTLPAVHELLHEQSAAVAKLEALLLDSLSLRVLNIPNPPTIQKDGSQALNRSKLAILFSGGLDCTVLARLSHGLLPHSEPIDLLNVAFENPRIHRQNGNVADHSKPVYELCPDRITGRTSSNELQRICPEREWRFVAIDVPYSETQRHRETVISLMHPHNTEMDLSIANALYFAARGEGYLTESVDSKPERYITSARVLLSGLGADELFGGYTRHATAFKRDALSGLLEELQLDVARLGKRNLGRDDRVMSHWSKEVRFPYLDEHLLSWALKASVSEKCGFDEPSTDALAFPADGESIGLEPGKKLLRCLAWKLEMRSVAKEKKRAIQFGARTAKMETGKTKGTQLLS